MSETRPIDGLIGRIPTSMESESAKNTIDKDGFMTLLIQQMKHQDPMNPQDSSEFSAQLAQFSTLEEMQNLNSLTEQGIEIDAVLAQSINNTMASNLVGTEVKAAGNEIKIADGDAGAVSFDLGNVGSDVEISIMDSSGNVIRTIEKSNLSSGEHSIEWDAEDKHGNTITNGTYSVEVKAVDSDGIKTDVVPYIIGTVDAVRYESSGAVLIVDGMRVEFGNVIEVRTGSGDSQNNGDPDDGTGYVSDVLNLLGF